MNPGEDLGIINFCVSRKERLQLRLLLLQQGSTFQGFFAKVVKEKLARHAKKEAAQAEGKAVRGA
jgi:hypothetical protein